MGIYQYSLVNDFNNNINLSQLHHEVLNSNIEAPLIGIQSNDDKITIHFTILLSQPEEVILNDIVSSHDAIDNIYMSNSLTANPRREVIRTDNYKRMCTFIFPGSSHCKFKIHSYKSNTLTSYSIRIYDITNRKLILQTDLNNNDEIPIDLGFGDNIPSNESILEVSAKKTGYGKAYMESIILQYP
jgi:hypothetical protein